MPTTKVKVGQLSKKQSLPALHTFMHLRRVEQVMSVVDMIFSI